MKKFRFRLERLLRQRALVERRARVTCALARAGLESLHSRMLQLQRYAAEQTPACEVRAYFERMEWASGALAQIRTRIRAAEEAAEAPMAALQEARARHGVIRSLKQRRFEAYVAARTRAQEREAEEITRPRISTSVR